MLKLGRLLGATALATLAMATTALAEYPEKPVEFVVPWPPGDLEDVLTRMIAEDFQAKYGVPAAVVNKPGGGGGVDHRLGEGREGVCAHQPFQRLFGEVRANEAVAGRKKVEDVGQRELALLNP